MDRDKRQRHALEIPLYGDISMTGLFVLSKLRPEHRHVHGIIDNVDAIRNH